ncbi:MAG: insulinase family protein [Spirochaetales bacterium]|nr:insulinase family protein [Spirochaetales bacterium]
MIRIEKLDNGATLLFENVSATDTASIGFWVLTGSRDEKDHEQGYSHFLEHMLFKGTEKRTAFQISKDIDRVGGILNAFTDKENCCYYCTLPGEHITLAIDVLSDILFHSTFPEEELIKEREVIINEIQISMDSPEEIAYELFLEEMWGDHPLSKRITGSIRDVQSVTREKIIKFHKERYVLSNMIISISGNYNLNEVKDSLTRALENIQGGSFLYTREKPVTIPIWKLIKGRFTQSHLFAGINTEFSNEQRDFYSLLVFSTLFGESMSSRLYQHIREEKGLCYSIYSFRTYFTDVIQWTIYANTQGSDTSRLIESIGDVLKKLTTEPVTTTEVDDAKSHLKGSLILAKENMEARMKRLFKLYTLNNTIFEFEESFNFLDTIRLQDIQNTIESLVKGEDFNLLVLGNKKSKNIKGLKFNF